jgi:hypothetical protein
MDAQNTARHASERLPKFIYDQFKPCFFVKHEWEEIVDKLCDSDDPHLRKIGQGEKLIMRGRKKVINA